MTSERGFWQMVLPRAVGLGVILSLTAVAVSLLGPLELLGESLVEVFGVFAANTRASGATVAIFAVASFHIVPFVMCFAAGALIERRFGTERVPRVATALLTVLVLASVPSDEVISSALQPQVRAVYSVLSDRLMLAVIISLGGWLFYKLVRWLIVDELDARRGPGDSGAVLTSASTRRP